jgi:hypothetical protein
MTHTDQEYAEALGDTTAAMVVGDNTLTLHWEGPCQDPDGEMAPPGVVFTGRIEVTLERCCYRQEWETAPAAWQARMATRDPDWHDLTDGYYWGYEVRYDVQERGDPG